MESIQELLRKLCKCIIKSDDGYKINIELEKSDPEPTPDPDPDPPAPDPEIDPNSPEAKFDPNIPLFIENAQESPFQLWMNYSGHSSFADPHTDISYSYDNITWSQLTFTTKDTTAVKTYTSNIMTLYRKGDRVYFKGNDTQGSVSSDVYPTNFACDGGDILVNIGGNITSLFYGKDDKYKTDYLDLSQITHSSTTSRMSELFGSLSSYIKTPPALPATTLIPKCYYGLLKNNLEKESKLEYIPALPATTLAADCYTYMFSSVSSNYYAVTNKTDKFYCFNILAESGKIELLCGGIKYLRINNPSTLSVIKNSSSTPTFNNLGVVYCPVDPGSKLPAGWKWIKVPPM